MRIVDTHCHPQFPQYGQDRDLVVARALDSGVGMICVGTELDDSASAIELAEKYEGVWASAGIHPNAEPIGPYLDDLERMARSSSKVIAIGEIGLDYYRTQAPEDQRRQRARFNDILALAGVLKLPAIIHCRDAHKDMINEVKAGQTGVIHSFNGSADEARLYIEKGLYIGLNAIAMFSKKYTEMIRSIPGDRLILETDAPYLAPPPHRGTRNEPRFVEIVAKYIADVRNLNYEAFISTTNINTMRLFNIHV